MASIKLHPPLKGPNAPSPLPQIVQTPSGLALLELQGTINHPKDTTTGEALPDFNFGRLDFPDYSPDVIGSAWMKRVFLYVGNYQRLNGELKKMPKAFAVVRKKHSPGEVDGDVTMANEEGEDRGAEEKGEELEVVEIIKYKLIFSGRPEPVGTAHAPS